VPEPGTLGAILATPGVVLKVNELANKIGQLLGMVETIGAKLDKLMKVHLNAGLEKLRAAQYITNKDRQADEIKAALTEFQKAEHLESSYRKALALYCRACCHSWLGDGQHNVDTTLRKILKIDGTPSLMQVVLAEYRKEGNRWFDIVSGVTGMVAWFLIIYIVTQLPPSELLFIFVFILIVLPAVFWYGAIFIGRALRRWHKYTDENAERLRSDDLQLILADGGDAGKLLTIQQMVKDYLYPPLPWVFRDFTPNWDKLK
jgi:hypothetical protein